MSKSQKRIEVLRPVVKSSNGNVTFAQLISLSDGYQYANNYKDYELKILSNENGILVGLVMTGHNKNLPPKKNKTTGTHSQLGIDITKENLSFGNVFLYDESLNVLFYEVNKNGCFLDDLTVYLQNKWNSQNLENQSEVKFYLVSRMGEYERLLKMTYFKEFVAEIANPTEVLQVIADNESSMLSTARKYVTDAAKANTDTMIVKFSTLGRKINKVGLTRQNVLRLVRSFQELFQLGLRKNVEVLKVQGYFNDPELPTTLQPINLIADTFNIHISLTDKILHDDLQETERMTEIKKLYAKHLSELKKIFKSTE
ncbi:MAG: hypothetical protein K2L05_03080 [Muribaculaceae bacterium]|nr:hypothetical protein [Muribaculaceae bacterium]